MAENPANQLRLVVFPIIYRVSYIPGGAGFQPSTVSNISYPILCRVSYLFGGAGFLPSTVCSNSKAHMGNHTAHLKLRNKIVISS